MKPARFEYHLAKSVADAVAALARHPDGARPIAGGQSLGPMLNMRVAQPELLIDLNGLAELAEIRRTRDTVRVGAMVRQHDLVRDTTIRDALPLLAHGASTIGHYATRQRGTVGGSLAHADPAAQLPALAVALGATLELAGPAGTRRVPADVFFLGTFETALAPDEILIASYWPIMTPDHGWGFRLVQRRPGDFAVALAAVVTCGDGGLSGALGGVGPIPVAFALVPERDPRWLSDAARAIAADLDLDDTPTVPAAYRREVAKTVLDSACRDALARVGETA